MQLAGEYQEELKVASRLAREAGDIILGHYASAVSVDYKDSHGQDPVTQADKDANECIVAGLRNAFPADAILAEESADDLARLKAKRLWLVDPLDGTKEFIERNGQFAVMIGLALEGRAVAGVVYQPTEDTLWWGGDGHAGAVIRGVPSALSLSERAPPEAPTLMVSRSHRPKWIDVAKQHLGNVTERPHGSVGLKVAAIARGDAEVYISTTSRTKEWDACAPNAIMEAAGGKMTTLEGKPLAYNKEVPNTPKGMLAATPVYQEPALQAVQAIQGLSPD